MTNNGTVPVAVGAGAAPVEEDGIPGNPVGALQELCMKLRWRPPFYETVIEEGLPHERTFGISCLVNNLSEMGTRFSVSLVLQLFYLSAVGNRPNVVVFLFPFCAFGKGWRGIELAIHDPKFVFFCDCLL